MDNPTTNKNTSAKGCLNGYEKIERFECKIKSVPLDIIVYVPGTTDPVNALKGKGNAADICYWVTNPGLVTLIEDLRKIYDNIYVNKDFSWSGDNSIDKRTKSGENLINFLIRYYSGRKNQKVTFHLIGHSHGGNVINEFTKQVDQNKSFPDNWKIKTIMYLSVPFFEELHHINTKCKKLHKNIKIINVFNHFDLTQRVVADFSMKQFGLLIDAFEKSERLKKAKETFKSIKPGVFNALKPSTSGVIGMILTRKSRYADNMTIAEGRAVWSASLETLEAVDSILYEIAEIFKSLNSTHIHFITDKINSKVQTIIKDLLKFIKQPITNLKNHLNADAQVTNGATTGTSVYTRSRFASDLMVTTSFYNAIKLTNNLLEYSKATYIGEFTSLLDTILLNQIDKFDNTRSTPEHQFTTKKIPVTHIPVRKYDPYNKLKDSEFSQFIGNMEALERKYKQTPTMQNRMQILFTFIAELPYKGALETGIDWAGKLQWPTFGDIDTELVRLETILKQYKSELDKRHCGIVYEPDTSQPAVPTIKPIPKGLEMCPNLWAENIKNPTPRIRPFVEQRGSVGYLAVTSHSISRLTLYNEVKQELESQLDTDLKKNIHKLEKLELKKISKR